MSVELDTSRNQNFEHMAGTAKEYKADPLLPPMLRFVNELGRSDIVEQLDLCGNDTPALVVALREIAPYEDGLDREQMDDILSLALLDYDDSEIARLIGVHQTVITKKLDAFCDDAIDAVDACEVDPTESITRHVLRLRGFDAPQVKIAAEDEPQVAAKPELKLVPPAQTVAATALAISMQETSEDEPPETTGEELVIVGDWQEPSDEDILLEQEMDLALTDKDIDEIVQDEVRLQAPPTGAPRTPTRVIQPTVIMPLPRMRSQLDLTTEKTVMPSDYLLQTDDSEEEMWQEKGLCAQTDPEAFFPEKGGSTREAKQICLGCEVMARCLQYALDNDERFGIWGGLSERERRRLKKGIV